MAKATRQDDVLEQEIPEKLDVIQEETPLPIKEDKVSKEEYEALLNRFKLLEKAVTKEDVPKNIVHDVSIPIEKPAVIKFTIAEMVEDDAIIDGFRVPGKALFDGFKFTDSLKCNEFGTIYSTGLEVGDLEFNSGLVGEDLADYQKEVRIAYAWIDKVSDKNPSNTNVNFWKNKKLSLENVNNIYSTDKIDDLILYYNIIGGGYPRIAKNYEEAKKEGSRLYLSVHADEVARKADYGKTVRRANAILDQMDREWKLSDLLHILYYLNTKQNHGYTLNTPREFIIEDFDDYVAGVDTKSEKKSRPQKFLDLITRWNSSISVQDKIRAEGLFRAAVYYGFVVFDKLTNRYENRGTGHSYASNIEKSAEFLINPKNIDQFAWLKNKVQDKWIN